jgi:hypothetical protein
VGLVPLTQGVFSFQPADYTANEQKTLFTVRDSYFLVTSCAVRVETAFTAGAPVIKVGTVATVDLLVAAADVTEGSTGVYLGSGTNKLLAPGTAVIVDWTGDAATTQGIARIVITGHRVAA